MEETNIGYRRIWGSISFVQSSRVGASSIGLPKDAGLSWPIDRILSFFNIVVSEDVDVLRKFKHLRSVP